MHIATCYKYYLLLSTTICDCFVLSTYLLLVLSTMRHYYLLPLAIIGYPLLLSSITYYHLTTLIVLSSTIFVVFSLLICYCLLLSAILCSTASNVSWYHLLISSMICYHLLPYLLSHFLLLVSSIISYYLL